MLQYVFIHVSEERTASFCSAGKWPRSLRPCVGHTFTLNVEAVISFETSVKSCLTALRRVQEDSSSDGGHLLSHEDLVMSSSREIMLQWIKHGHTLFPNYGEP
jgi:hypothetical protein